MGQRLNHHAFSKGKNMDAIQKAFSDFMDANEGKVTTFEVFKAGVKYAADEMAKLLPLEEKPEGEKENA